MKGIFSKSFGIAAIAALLGFCIPNKCQAADESSPWGIVPVWSVGQYPASEWRQRYTPKLDSVVSCGISWIRPNCMYTKR